VFVLHKGNDKLGTDIWWTIKFPDDTPKEKRKKIVEKFKKDFDEMMKELFPNG